VPKPLTPEASRITDLGFVVYLTESELAVARSMGVSPERYAIEMIKREQEETRPQ
jgi:hypothetical protein